VEIITRAQWRAEHAAGFGPAPMPAREVWLHHSATSAGAPGSSLAIDILSVRLLETIGQQRFGGGISYTFAVTPSGRVFEGTGPARLGSHTRGHNTIGRAIVLVGNYDLHEPAPGQLHAVAQLLTFGHAQGWWIRPALDGGHRDASGASTDCPGRFAEAHVRDINRDAAGQGAGPAREEPDLTDDERRMLTELHAATCTEHHDFRGHHDAPDDIPAGQVLSIRNEMHELFGGLSAQLAGIQAAVAQQLRTSAATAPPVSGPAAGG
jgi:N-acetylmuramoyl-L-alanine amidase-like protein